MSYQTVTGTLNPGAHPGSYNGQDAYNDMLVTDNGNMDNTQAVLPHRGAGGLCGDADGDGLQRPADGDNLRGGLKQ